VAVRDGHQEAYSEVYVRRLEGKSPEFAELRNAQKDSGATVAVTDGELAGQRSN
jgi:hypothetical protein